MFSPQDRIFTTPDVSVPAAEALLQQIRLERILKRLGYFHCCTQTTDDGVEPPLGSKTYLPPKPTTLTPLLRVHNPCRKEPKFPKGRVRGTSKKTKEKLDAPLTDKPPRSKIPGAPYDDPYLQKSRDTVGGSKYGGVHLTRNGLQPLLQQPPLFKPFYPQRSPLRLPAIQREKSADQNCSSRLNSAVVRHVEPVPKHRKDRAPLEFELKEDRARVRKKLADSLRKQREMEFIEWETDQARHKHVSSMCKEYEARDNIDFHMTDHIKHEFWEHRMKNAVEENYQRERISSGIKHSIQQRVTHFGNQRKKLGLAPVLDMTFPSNLK